MNRCCVDLYRSKWFPMFLVAFLMLIHFLSGYPGGMTADSIDQFRQSLSFKFNAHHPPMMAMLWSVLNYIRSGPQVMLLLHLSLLWSSVLFLYYADDSNKYRWMYFVMPFVPNILSESTMIWKDIAFGSSFFFVFAGCVYYLYKKEKAPLWVSFIFLLIAFYSSAIKFQAKFVLPVLVFFIVSISTNKNLWFKIVSASVLSLTIIFTNGFIIDKFSLKTSSGQLRQFFDMANIAKDIDDDSLLPDHIKNTDIYNFAKLKEKTNHIFVNPLVFPEDKIYIWEHDEERLNVLENSFYKMVFSHPISYLKHRFFNFMSLMNNGYSHKGYSETCHKDELRDLGVNTTAITFVQKPFISFLKIYFSKLRKNFISLFLTFLYIGTILRLHKSPSKERTVLSYVVVIGMIFSLTLFFTTMANDYRYYYIVRLLSFFAIPIYLKSRLYKFRSSK